LRRTGALRRPTPARPAPLQPAWRASSLIGHRPVHAASTSFIFVDANQVGHLKRIYAFKELPPGRIIALDGEKGPQAQILGPGFHFIPLVRVLYDFEEWDVVTIPEGYYGQLTALDGRPCRRACSWPRPSPTKKSATC
jgi:hypothetical protein